MDDRFAAAADWPNRSLEKAATVMNATELQEVPDFTGKVLSISIMDDDNSHDLASPSFEMQGGRMFIVGSIPEGASESSWTKDAQGAVAWDRVTDYLVFDSIERYATAIKISEQAKPEGSE